MTLQINENFIKEWENWYDEKKVADDEPRYKKICELVASDISKQGSLSRQTFEAIWAWKGAMRVIRFIRLDKYESLYAEAFRRAIRAPTESKLSELISEEKKLPGVGAPTGSTILHFMFPDTMPIMDVRTVEVLHKAERIKWKDRSLENYNKFKTAIERIREHCGRSTLRQIDRALFAYHKIELTKKSGTSEAPCGHQ